MDILEKLTILADAAKYDVSCSSSGSRRRNINIAERRNPKLHLQKLPRRYWEYLTEKQ